jgi:hypothetical protein
MADIVFPTLTVAFKNDFDRIEYILKVYSMAVGKSIRPFEMVILKYYMYHGYTQEAKDFIKEDEKKTDGQIRVAETHLRDKGFLKLGVLNQRKSTLSPELELLRKNFILDRKNIYALVFKNETA